VGQASIALPKMRAACRLRFGWTNSQLEVPPASTAPDPACLGLRASLNGPASYGAPGPEYPGCFVAVQAVPVSPCEVPAGVSDWQPHPWVTLLTTSGWGLLLLHGAWAVPRTITVRKALWHLPLDVQDRLLQAIIGKTERDELGSLLKRICACQGETGLELEFWFEGCSDREATHYASAAIRDAAASIAEPA